MKNIWILALLVYLIPGCKQTTEKAVDADDQVEMETSDTDKGGITLTEVESPAFTDARLFIKEPLAGANIPNGPVDFNFHVEEYELGAQTGDADVKLCANSAKGQHIHLILNNGPYTAHYGPDFTQEIPDGNYTALAFLSRSYHESIKTVNAYQLFDFSVGDDADILELNTEYPHMFYSRPK